MKKELFKLLMAEFQKLGINPTQWIGTRTNVKRLGPNNMATTSINEPAMQRVFDEEGIDRILKLFTEESKYLATLNDMQGQQLLNNLKITNKVVKPPKKPEAGIYSLKDRTKQTPKEFTEAQTNKENELRAAILKAAFNVSTADRTLAKRLGLDTSKIADFEKLQVWKDKHGVPDFAKEGKRGIESLFKIVEDNPLADLGTQLDKIKAEGKNLVGEAQKLVDLAWKMSPEGQAAEEAIRKDINRRSSEGKGFAGGVFGARNDGFFRAVVRPFLLDQHDKGIIKIADNTLESLKNSDDLKAMGDFQAADPVRVFRQHYGDDAFDLIPDQEAFGGGQWGPTSQERIDVLNKVIGKPIMKVGPERPGGYLTKGEYQAKLDHQDEVLGYINNKEGRFGDMTEKELAQEIADVKRVRASLLNTFMKTHPTANFQKKDFPQNAAGQKAWQDAEVNAQRLEIEQEALKIKKKLEPEVSGIDQALKSDFEGAVTKEGFTDPFPGKKTPKKKIDRPSIRLIKNFEKDLTDEGLALEGYNLQEIGILKRARQVMKDEGQNPDDALTWVRGEMADDAGVDIEEFMPDFDWGDFPGKDSFAQGGGVGSMFRRV